MAIRFDDIGNRLKAFRLGSGLSADEIANRLGISRTALYRFEKGELAKIETLEKLAELLEVSVPTLLGVGVEYIASAVAYFERMRQIEETSEHIIVLAGPISYLLASDAFDRTLDDVLRENVPDKVEGRKRSLEQVDEVMDGAAPAQGQLSAPSARHRQSDRRIGDGALPAQWDGRPPRPAGKDAHATRRALARAEAAHFATLMADEPIGVQIGIVPDTLPHASFQIFRQPDRHMLALSARSGSASSPISASASP